MFGICAYEGIAHPVANNATIIATLVFFITRLPDIRSLYSIADVAAKRDRSSSDVRLFEPGSRKRAPRSGTSDRGCFKDDRTGRIFARAANHPGSGRIWRSRPGSIRNRCGQSEKQPAKRPAPFCRRDFKASILGIGRASQAVVLRHPC
jgi:hypothetical protein